ncbi:MAG: hypothetical protein MI924_25540 [Chloroflexales bacterium]|nr:hypothetical protein [Chloroflexales bacterium]
MTLYQFDDDQQHVADDQTIPLYQPAAQPTLWDRLLDRPIEWSAALIALIVVVAWLAASLPPVSVPDQAGISPTPTLGVPAVKAPQTPRLEKAVIAYDAPDGSELGALEPGRSYTVVARYGAAWAQLDAPGSGLVWVKAVDIGAPWATVPDVQPTATPQVVLVEVAPVQPMAPQPEAAQPPAIAKEDWNDECHPPMPCALPRAPAPVSASEASREALQQLGLDPLGNAFGGGR